MRLKPIWKGKAWDIYFFYFFAYLQARQLHLQKFMLQGGLKIYKILLKIQPQTLIN